MAMLAEPRRRKRYNLCPRGKALYEDDNRFGTKMLEKMGWEKGNGLGARQDGDKDFVRIRFKNDAEGLGYEAKDDQWTTHEEGFNGLLKSLNGGEEEKRESGSEDEARPMGFGFKAENPVEKPSKKKLKENISGMSLEERSKQSKARVHYQKFTRGKDLSQYSEKDLANIFGKKATEDIAAPVAIEQPKEENQVSPNFGGVQTVSTGLSVSDYFKQKMEAMKNRLKNGSAPVNGLAETAQQVNGSEVDAKEAEPENAHEETIKKKKKRTAESTVEPPVAKKKKKSKGSFQDEAAEEAAPSAESTPAEDEDPVPKKKKKNKKDKKEQKEETAEILVETIEDLGELAPKKKKKSKKAELNDSEIIVIDDQLSSRDDQGTNEAESSHELVGKKKKKSKKCEVNVSSEEYQLEAANEDNESPTKKKKKSKHNKCPEETLQTETPAPDSAEKSSKKKKKSKSPVEPTPELEVAANADAAAAVEKPSFKKIRDNGGRHTDIDVSAARRLLGDKQPEDLLSTKEIEAKLKSFNTCIISQFCAEKFQMFEMSAFRNSTLGEIVGYGTSTNVELKVVENRADEKRITNLWQNLSTEKYEKTKDSRNIQYPTSVQRTTIRAVKKRVAFQGI